MATIADESIAKRFDTAPLLRELSILLQAVMDGRDDEPTIRASMGDGRASFRFSYDSSNHVLAFGLAFPDGKRVPLDAIFGDGHEHAGRRIVDVLFELAAPKHAC